MNVTNSKSATWGGGKLPQPEVAQRLADYCRRQWVKTLPQLNQYQRQLAVFVLSQYHEFEPKQLVGLLAKSRSQIYSDLQSIEFYKKTEQFKADAENMRLYIINGRQFIY